MTSRSREHNRFQKLNLQVKFILADIKFLKTCKKKNLTPKFIEGINIKVKNYRTEKVLQFAKEKWLSLEIKYLYGKLNTVELELYNLHLKLAKENKEDWDTFCIQVYVVNEHKYLKKVEKLEKKLSMLMRITSDKPNNQNNNNMLVKNETNIKFTKSEMEILNKGLKFSFRNNNGKGIEELIGNIENGIRFLNETDKNYVRKVCKMKIAENIKLKKIGTRNSQELEVIKSLRNRNCYFLKADKGNTIVILNKEDYVNRVNNLLKEEMFMKLKKNPINKFVKETVNIIRSCNLVIPKNEIYKFNVSNAVIPRLYCLPKIHKEGNLMRPIVSGIDSPTYLLSKWLNKVFGNFKFNIESSSIKNTGEFINKLKNIELTEDEIFVSFDVCSLFPSIPVAETLILLKEFLIENNIEINEVNEYVKLTKCCMTQNYFSFNNVFYQQKDGTAMGNSLSPFIAELFMKNFEKELRNKLPYFPRVWIRYVDDVFAIFNTKEFNVEHFLSLINNEHKNIKFTFEIEHNKCLPFLDVLCFRNNNKIEFDIYRKHTNNDRYIPVDSNHCKSHKLAAFNTMVNRLITIPLHKNRFKCELARIKEIAKFNGYDPKIIDNILRKQKLKKFRNDSTTLITQKENVKNKFISLPFDMDLTKGLDKVFKQVNLKVAYKSLNSLKNVLGNPKDKIKMIDKSGIYKINCNSCSKIYIGQTKRKILTRFNEHISHIKFQRPEKSSVAEHILNTKHTLELNDLKLLKTVNSKGLLNSFESLYIHKYDENNLLNCDKGPIPKSQLYSLIRR